MKARSKGTMRKILLIAGIVVVAIVVSLYTGLFGMTV
jgi:flagellar basal body-associated protein FliL